MKVTSLRAFAKPVCVDPPERDWLGIRLPNPSLLLAALLASLAITVPVLYLVVSASQGSTGT